MALIPIIKATAVAVTCLEVMIKWQSARHMTHLCWSTLSFFLTSGLTDHDIAVFALSPIVKALHLYIIGGLGLQVSNHVPVFLTWECKRKEGGRDGRKETKVRYRFLEQALLTNVAQTLSKLILCLLFMSHTFTEVMLLHVLSLSSKPPPQLCLHLLFHFASLKRAPTVALLYTSSIYGSFVFVLASVQSWRTHCCYSTAYNDSTTVILRWNPRWQSTTWLCYVSKS